MKFYHPVLITLLICLFNSCNAQSTTGETTPQPAQLVGGPCEGCEAIHEYGDRELSPVDTLPGFHSNEPKLKLHGTVYQKDGVTPAPNVILYIYHTDRNGIYTPGANPHGWERRHGQHRGWIKTDATGKYTFFTFRPASYPNRNEAEHIHLTIKEPDKNEYYVDDFLFDDDPLLTDQKRSRQNDRAGSGIVQLVKQGNLHVARRDIILGLNIPNYD